MLCFADGSVYTGLGLGIEGEATGALCHFHGPIDPQFLLTDPAVKDLMILTTEPVIGGWGIRRGIDQSDDLWASGLICREIVDFPTHEGHFKNFHRMLESHGGIALTYLDPDPLVVPAGKEPRVTVLSGAETRLTETARRLMVEELGREPAAATWDDSASVKRSTDMECASPAGKILIIDLGIRKGMLRFLRDRYSVMMVNPSESNTIPSMNTYDGIVISGGPGQIPSDDLITHLSRITDAEHPPIYAYGIGSLAMGMASGLQIIKMDRSHRGMSVPVRIEDDIKPTYQTHSRTFADPSGDWTVTGRCTVDNMIESLRKTDRSVFLSMYDPAPDLRSLDPSDPLSIFMESTGKMAGGRRT
ncbi:MAG: carbamoyl-phosphate synthase domain-containing protein [Thermoplasmatota archaeon]